MLGFFKEVIRQHYLILLLAISSAVFWPIKQHVYEYLSKTSISETTTSDVAGVRLFTPDELSKYNGEENSLGIYLAILGSVYDVQKGSKHYGVGGGYHFFVGRDGSTAFISGDFETVNDKLDDVLTLQPRDMLSLKQWKEFYDKDYIFKGLLIGRYYDDKGQETEYFHKVQEQIDVALEDKRKEDLKNLDYPPCNVEWNASTGTRLWCTKESGGIDRHWVGVPRKYYEAGATSFRCACIHSSKLKGGNIKEYEGCDPKSKSCFLTPENSI